MREPLLSREWFEVQLEDVMETGEIGGAIHEGLLAHDAALRATNAELLEALKFVVVNLSKGYIDYQEFIDKAQQAIAKAEGRTT